MLLRRYRAAVSVHGLGMRASLYIPLGTWWAFYTGLHRCSERPLEGAGVEAVLHRGDRCGANVTVLVDAEVTL